MMAGSVSYWLELCRSGHCDSAEKIWRRYHRRIVGLANRILGNSGCGPGDEEDVAQETFNSFFIGLKKGRFPRLVSREDLWRLLSVITKRKSIDHLRRARRCIGAGSSSELEADRIVASGMAPALSSELREEYDRLMKKLDEKSLREVATLKLKGYKNTEIARELGCCRRTVIRKLDVIRSLCQESIFNGSI